MSEEQSVEETTEETALAQVEAVPTDITNPDKITEAITKIGVSFKMTAIENPSDYNQAKHGLSIWRGLRKMVKEKHKDAKADILEKGRTLDGFKTLLLKAIDDEEKPLLQLRHDYDDKKKAEKEAKEAAERERVLNIDRAINQMRKVSTQRFESSEQILEAITELSGFAIGEEQFEDKIDNAFTAREETLKELDVILKDKMHDEQRVKDLAQQKADQAVEAKKLAKEREQLDADKAERERVDLIDAAIKKIGEPATKPFESLPDLLKWIENLTDYEPDEATYQEKLPNACEARIETLKWLDGAKKRLEYEADAKVRSDADKKKLADDRAEFEAEKQKDADAKAAKEKAEREAAKGKINRLRLTINSFYAVKQNCVTKQDWEKALAEAKSLKPTEEHFGELIHEAGATVAKIERQIVEKIAALDATAKREAALQPDQDKMLKFADDLDVAIGGVGVPTIADESLRKRVDEILCHIKSCTVDMREFAQ